MDALHGIKIYLGD